MEFFPGFQNFLLRGLIGKAYKHSPHVSVGYRNTQALGCKTRSISGNDLVAFDLAPQLQRFLLTFSSSPPM